jgi:hypothetical protein
MTSAADLFGPFRRDLPDRDRAVQLAELRTLALMLLGPAHKLTRALQAADRGNEAALSAALAEIDALPALRRRKILSTFAVLRRPQSTTE